MKHLLIFDAYGTLFSTGTGSIDAVKKILGLQDKAISPRDFYADWKRYHRMHMDECNAGVFLTERNIFAMDLKMLYEQYGINRRYEQDVEIMLGSLLGRQLFAEVSGTIVELRKRYRVVIGSTTDTAPLLINMQENHFAVDEVYTSEQIGKYKPAKEFYEYILQREGCRAEEAVFIGDSLVDDILGPSKAGLTTVLVDRKKQYKQGDSVKPDCIVADLSGMMALNL